MKVFVQILFLVFVLQIYSVSSANASDENYIETEGVAYPEVGLSLNQLRRIAIMDAYRYLAEQVDTLHVTSETTVKNLRELDESISAKVDAALRGAKVVSVTRDARDGSFHAFVRMSIYGSNQSLSAAVLQENIVKEEFLKPKITNLRSEIHYTGLVIDCRGLNLALAVTPAIKSVSGIEVYAYKNIGYQTTVEKGLIEYSNSMDSSRAGSSPLVVKAKKISGDCDVIVSDEDANKILAANQVANILVNCAVVLVR